MRRRIAAAAAPSSNGLQATPSAWQQAPFVHYSQLHCCLLFMLFSPNAHALLLGQRNVALLLLLLLTLAVVRAVAMQRRGARRRHCCSQHCCGATFPWALCAHCCCITNAAAHALARVPLKIILELHNFMWKHKNNHFWQFLF